MRVLYYLDSLNRGGAEMQALDVCRNAQRFGIEMTLVAGGGGALETDFMNAGVEFIRLSRKLPVDLYLASQLRRIVREGRIEIVHGYQAVDGLHLYLATHGLKRVRRVLSFQGFIQDRRNRLASRFLIRRMHLNIVVSHGLRQWLAEKDRLEAARDFTVLYNGADPQRLVPTGASLRGELGLSESTRLIGMVGNFYRDPRKDQLTVCRALPAIFAEFSDVHCVFAGRVEDGAEGKFADCLNFCVENNITDRVHFLGGRDNIPDVLAALEVFVFSSLHEGLPVAVSEAMLAGVPLVVSDIAPLIEASGDGRYAEVFQTGDARSLADKLFPLLRSEAKRQELSASALEFAEKNLSIDAHLKRLAELYRSLLEPGS